MRPFLTDAPCEAIMVSLADGMFTVGFSVSG